MGFERMPEAVWLGLDLGTQSVRAMLVSETGDIIGIGSAIFPEVINCVLTEIRFRDQDVALLRYKSDVAPMVNHQSSKESQ